MATLGSQSGLHKTRRILTANSFKNGKMSISRKEQKEYCRLLEQRKQSSETSLFAWDYIALLSTVTFYKAVF